MLDLRLEDRGRRDLCEETRVESCDDAFLAFDVLSGKRHPELGGSPETLDIAGFNNYGFGRWSIAKAAPTLRWRRAIRASVRCAT
jgi:hypothetical protein